MTIDNRTRWLALIVLCLGALMIVLDTTIVNVALPSIRADLGFSQTSLAWVVNAYLLTFGGFLLLGGRLGDLYGHRRLFLAGIALFTLASLVLRPRRHRRGCSIAARAVQGLGGAVVVGGRALADDDALHRAGRAREGDGRLRLRRGGRRQHRRAARRRPDRARSTGTGSSSSTCRSASSSCVLVAPAAARRAARGVAEQRLDVAGAVTVTGVADARRLRDRQRQPAGWTSAQTLGLLGAAVALLALFLVDRVARQRAADAARAVPAAQRRDRERRRRAVGGGDVRVVLPLGALPAARARLQPAAGRARVPAGEPDHGRVLARPLGEARHAVRHPAAARRRAAARRGRARAVRARAGRRQLRASTCCRA